MSNLSKQQLNVVNAPLEPSAVVACAGSGKTNTAVHRLANIRNELVSSRSHIALLSFSNIAVETFKRSFSQIVASEGGAANNRVSIDTFDAFITSYILRPHAYRTMKCKSVPFLLSGAEPFIQNRQYTFWCSPAGGTDFPVKGPAINNIAITTENNIFKFVYRSNNALHAVNNGPKVAAALGATGAYTHELGKYWALRTLIDQPGILKSLANRFAHIIVDEAQDIGLLHQCILQLLSECGTTISLIGDPSQAIYDFAGATGKFIKEYDADPKVSSFELSTNYRSIPNILNVANKLSGRKDLNYRMQPKEEHGAYFAFFEPKDHEKLVKAFLNKIDSMEGLAAGNSAVLYRGNSGKDKLRKASKKLGQGKVKILAEAAIERDANQNYHRSFKLVINALVGLFKDAPDNLSALIQSPGDCVEARMARQDIWRYIRSTETGLPHASLKGSSDWHEKLKKTFPSLLGKIAKINGYTPVDNIGRKLAKKGLSTEPLIPKEGLEIDDRLTVRVDTVHQTKGESLDAVLYMAEKSHVDAMLNGVNTELGRIGYVAVTRAKGLFILGVPKAHAKALTPELISLGLKELA